MATAFLFWPSLRLQGLITDRLLSSRNQHLSPTAPNDFNPARRPMQIMNTASDNLRAPDWRNAQFSHGTTPSPFQSSHQAINHAFVHPPLMPLPPPIPLAASLPTKYYDSNGTYYHASHYSAVHSPWGQRTDHCAPGPQQPGPGYYDTQSPVPPTQNNSYQLNKSDSSASTVDLRASQLTTFSQNPTYGLNPLYLGRAQPLNHQHVTHQGGPPTKRHDGEPRGRKRNSPPESQRIQSKDRAEDEPHRLLGPSTPKRGFDRAASRRRQSRPPSEGFLQSAKRISRDLLMPSWKSCREDQHNLAMYRYEDQALKGSPRERETDGQGQVSRPATPPARSPRRPPSSRKHKPQPSAIGGRLSQTTCSKKPGCGHRALPRDYSAQHVSPVQKSTAENTADDPPHARPDSSGFDGQLEISKMNWLLDIWDSMGNPDWERETFALCDLDHCSRCGKYYVPMRTLRHNCRR